MTAARRGRVLMLVENAPVPADRRVWNEARTLRDAGYAVTVICPAPTEMYPDRADAPHEVLEEITILRFRLEPADRGLSAYLREYGQALWRMQRLVRRTAAEGPIEVVHVANPPDFLLLAAMHLRRTGTRFVFDHHDLVPELFESRYGTAGIGRLRTIVSAMERLAFSLSDVVLSTNESYREVAIGRGRKRPEDVFVVRNGPDLNRFCPVAPDPTLRRDRRHLISYVGLMGPQDGIDHALRALAALRERRDDDWLALFVGLGEMVEPMRRLASELGLDGLVDFIGWRYDEDVRLIVSSSDVCLAPDPPSPLNDVSTMVKIPEYMAMGRAIASYDLRESRVSAGDAALYAQPGDPEDLGRCIDELLDDPARRTRMGEIGRRRVETELAWQHSAATMLDAYEHLSHGSASSRRPAPEVRTAELRA